MKMKMKYLFLLILGIGIFSCSDDDDPKEIPHDPVAQALIDDAVLIEFLQTHYLTPEKQIDTITNGETPLYDIVSTVIHEYTHYLQSRNLYQKYEKVYYYSTNPYEREARRNEKIRCQARRRKSKN